MNQFPKAALLLTAITLSACSMLQSEKVDYRTANVVKTPSLDVPPDLTQLAKDTRYVVIDGAVSAASMRQPGAGGQTTTAATSVAALSIGDVRVERAGNQRWLVVRRPAEKLWDSVKDFWLESGFELVKDQRDLGILETDWKENRDKIPMDFIRRTIGKVFDSLYSSGERDKYRTRLERNASGDTEIFISHRGTSENYVSGSKEQTAWQSSPADPELEAEFLGRLMVKLGTGQEQSKALLASGRTSSVATISTENGQPTVRIEEGFDRAWRRVGLALDRTGFTVEDRDRNKGLYFVRYAAPNAEKTETGFFAKLFSSSVKEPDVATKLRISVRSLVDVTTVSVLNDQGIPETSAVAQRIVKVLAEDIK